MRIASTPLRWLALALILPLAACDSSDDGGTDEPPPAPTPTTGTITGRAVLPPGVSGSVTNARVAIYSGLTEWENDSFVFQVGAGADGSFSIANIPPGTYYLDVWKDNDGNGFWSAGDLIGVWGSLSAGGSSLTPIPVSAGGTVALGDLPITLAGSAPLDRPAPAD
jgi:hypothetical protein